MNERIKELAKQAYEDVISNTPSFLVTREMYEQKFAELIIKECAAVITAHADSLAEYEFTAKSETAKSCANIILEHFGEPYDIDKR